MRTFGATYFGPGSATYDYSSDTDNVGNAYVDPVVYNSTYPGAGSQSTPVPGTDVVIPITGANFISPPPNVTIMGSDPSEWALPNFNKPASLLPWVLVAAAVAGGWYLMSSPTPRRRRRSRA